MADIPPVRSQASLVNKRFITRLKMFGKNLTIMDWKDTLNFMRAILTFSKTNKEKTDGTKRKQNLFYVNSFRIVRHKPTRKTFKSGLEGSSGTLPGPMQMEQSDWLILVIDPLN